MVTIDTQNTEMFMHDFAISYKQQLWIGLYTVLVRKPRSSRLILKTNKQTNQKKKKIGYFFLHFFFIKRDSYSWTITAQPK